MQFKKWEVGASRAFPFRIQLEANLMQFETIRDHLRRNSGNLRQFGEFKTTGSIPVAGVAFFAGNLRRFLRSRREFKTMGSMPVAGVSSPQATSVDLR